MRNFTYKHCTSYGINDKYFNVLHETGAVIGYINEEHLIEFINGNNTHFRPIAGYKYTFSQSLIQSLSI